MITLLSNAGVTRVIDVRAIAASRRPGFSKTSLAASLVAQGIEYIHLRALGTPRNGREAARAGRIDELRAIYRAHLAEPATQSALLEAADLVRAKPSALLCYCAIADHCHRHVIAPLLGADAIVDL